MAEFDIGDKIKHKVFGEGTIVDIAEGDMNKLTIAFKDGEKLNSLLWQQSNTLKSW